MATAGRTVTTGNNFWQQNTGSDNQQGMLFTMPENGLITGASVYVSGNGGTITGQLCLWDASGNLLAQTGNITFSSGSTGINAQAWQTANFSTAYLATGGTNYIVGFWRASASTANFSWENSGGTIYPQVNSGVAKVAAPSALHVASHSTGQLSAYVTYTPGTTYAYDGATEQLSTAQAYDGAAWQTATAYAWDGTTWQLV